MIFNPIAIDNWSRKPYYEHYLNHVRCTYSMTANIDITRLLSELKKKRIKPYPALIHMISTVVNRHSEFRTNDFYSRYLDDMEMYGSVKEFAAKANEPPNTFPISSIPWVSFTGFNLNVYNEGTYLLPTFTIGKYFQHDEKILLPLSGQFHHAVCDGYHAGVLYNELQLRADTCGEWLQTIN